MGPVKRRGSMQLERIRIVRWLYAIVAVLTAAFVAIRVWHAVQADKVSEAALDLVHLNGEGNIASYFSALLLLAASLLAWFNSGTAPSARVRAGWILLSITFAFLSFDEAAQIHEFFDLLIMRLWTDRGLVRWPWALPYIAFACIVAWTCVPLLRSLSRDVAVRFVVAGSIYVVGAAGIDLLEGAATQLVRVGHGDLRGVPAMLPVLEEPLEMLGVIVFIDALLLNLKRLAPSVALRFHDRSVADPRVAAAAGSGLGAPRP
jgi:hypothetical protein